MKYKTKTGQAFPLGATPINIENQQGVNFSLFSSQAKKVELCLFDELNQEIRFPILNKSQDIFHIWIADVPAGTKYAYRIYSDKNSPETHRTLLSNPQKLMLDPYAKAVVGKPDLSSPESRQWFMLNDERDNAAVAPKALVVCDAFDWENDERLNIPWGQTIIYELHVKGFTQLYSKLPKAIRGTYAGLAHADVINYLKELGITAVELLPINYSLDEPHLQEKGLANYWGYNPLAMFAVESKYAATENPLTEFKTMVKALHRAGIEVILDVVFNHSAESEKHFATFSQRGIDDSGYYWQNQQGNYCNFTGCGNTLNVSTEQGRRWVVDCLKYWVEECHIDGFRFDLGVTLGRDSPAFNVNAQLFQDIFNEPSLQGIKLIAEPWDIGENGYQLGHFPIHFSEWNARFRDDMRRFWLWQSGDLGEFAQRFAGSSDIFQSSGRKPHGSINFITAHDGFTLHDLVSYNHKHNAQNGENNRDGHNENYSYNHGVEGSAENLPELEKSAVENQRYFTCSALLHTLLLSNGTPMLLAGDEFGNTQYGNNNAYCQDNEITWLKWSEFEPRLFELVKNLIALRKKIQSTQGDFWWTEANVSWLNETGAVMSLSDWHNPNTKAMQILLDNQWLLLINGKTAEQKFVLPTTHGWKYEMGDQIKLDSGVGILASLGFCVLKPLEI